VRRGLRIRLARPEDIPHLQKIFNAEENLDKLERYSDDYLSDAIKNSDHLFLIGHTLETLRGFIWITGLSDKVRGPKIEEFGSIPSGLGFGSCLLIYALRQLLQRRCDKVWLAVASDNERAIRFYRRFKFIDKEIRKSAWLRRSGDVADGLIMEISASDLDNLLSIPDKKD